MLFGSSQMWFSISKLVWRRAPSAVIPLHAPIRRDKRFNHQANIWMTMGQASSVYLYVWTGWWTDKAARCWVQTGWLSVILCNRSLSYSRVSRLTDRTARGRRWTDREVSSWAGSVARRCGLQFERQDDVERWIRAAKSRKLMSEVWNKSIELNFGVKWSTQNTLFGYLASHSIL